MLKIFLVICSLSCAFTQITFPAGTNVPNICICGTAGQCSVAGGGAPTDGSDNPAFQARILNNGPVISPSNVTSNMTCSPVTTGLALAADSQDDCDPGLDRCCPPNGFTCGLRYPPPVNAPIAINNQANYGDFGFTVALFTMNDVYIGVGAIIDQFHVLTAAHKVSNISGTQVKVRIGDWNLFATNEPFPSFTINATFAIHPNFTVANLKNNIAILTLSQRVQLGKYPTITNICLPNTNITNMRCFASGWGKVDNTTSAQNILNFVDLPLVDQTTCQTQLRNTSLGRSFALDRNSFICAGGEAGKDSCTGDGGSPLSCFVGGRYYLVGLTAWGIGCGLANVPGVYVNVQTYIPWIQSFIANQINSAGTATTRGTSPAITPSTTAQMGGTQATTIASTASAASTARTNNATSASSATTTARTNATLQSTAQSTVRNTGQTTFRSTVKATAPTTTRRH